MPTNRTRRTRKLQVDGLTRPEKHLLLTGKPFPPSGSWTDYGEKWLRPHLLILPYGRAELRALWLAYRDELLKEWKKSGKPGLPWAAEVFDKSKELKGLDQ